MLTALPLVPGIVDRRGRFREIHAAVREARRGLWPDDLPTDQALRIDLLEPSGTGRPVALGSARLPMRVLIVPGLYGDCVAELVTPFAGGLEHLAAFGYRTGILPVSGRSSSEHNARQILDHLCALPLDPAERLVLIGYSKGICDILEAVVAHRRVRWRVAAVVSLAGAVGGSVLADELPDDLEAILRELHLPSCDPGDGGGIASLSRAVRQRWLKTHRLPHGIPYFSLVALPEPGHVSAILLPGYNLISRTEPLNDGQVILSDAVIPGSVLLGYANADHWAAALPLLPHLPPDLEPVAAPFLDRNAYPREVLLEAVVRHVEEVLLEDALQGGRVPSST